MYLLIKSHLSDHCIQSFLGALHMTKTHIIFLLLVVALCYNKVCNFVLTFFVLVLFLLINFLPMRFNPYSYFRKKIEFNNKSNFFS